MNWKLLALGSAFFAGLTAVLGKVGVKDIPSNFATLIRTLVVIPLLVALVIARDEWRHPGLLPKRSLLFLVLSGLATGLSWICYYRALQEGPASIVAPLDKLSLLLAVALSVVFLGERLSAMQWTGALLMGAGALLLAFK